MSRPTRASTRRDAEAAERAARSTGLSEASGEETGSEYQPLYGLDVLGEEEGEDDDDYETEEEEEDGGTFQFAEDGESADEEDLEALAEMIQEEIATGGTETRSDEDADDGGGNRENVIDTSVLLSRAQLLRLLGTVDFGNVRIMNTWRGWQQARDRAEQDTEGVESTPQSGSRSASHKTLADKTPSATGRELIDSSTFGHTERRQGRIYRAKRQARRILERELGSSCYGKEKAVTPFIKHDMIPEDTPDMIIHYGSRCYSGQFSTDGNFFFSCSQDMRVRMYDTSNPYQWKYYKQVIMPYGQWTITDASLTADNKWLAYSSMSHIICLAPTDPLNDAEPRALDLSKTIAGRSSRMGSAARWFSAFSVRFSGDGRELVAGTGDNCVYVFDIERDSTVLRISNHDDDVNAVCFGDVNSPHILYSGSDDCTVKVWDRRSMGDGRAAGVFLGHTEGVTYVDSAGDGRYVVSNGKDQTAKLWDLRKVIPTDRADKINTYKYSQGWDYRGGGYDIRQWRAHPFDCSLVTFRGHAVEKTLIRCHFSPQGSTDKRYIYSGSADGKIYIWNMDATLHGTIDVADGTTHLRERDTMDLDYHWGARGGFGTVIRDVSWHPHVPMIAATAWNGWSTGMGTCTVHSWNDGLSTDDSDHPIGLRVNAQLHPEQHQSRHPDDDDDDDEDITSDSTSSATPARTSATTAGRRSTRLQQQQHQQQQHQQQQQRRRHRAV